MDLREEAKQLTANDEKLKMNILACLAELVPVVVYFSAGLHLVCPVAFSILIGLVYGGLNASSMASSFLFLWLNEQKRKSLTN